jgi:hypothetical protein
MGRRSIEHPDVAVFRGNVKDPYFEGKGPEKSWMYL